MLEAANGPRIQTLATPISVVEAVERILGARFTIDVAAEPATAKAPMFFTVNDNGLAQLWHGLCWCNPPYKSIDPWVRKAHSEAEAGRAQTVMLLPARTSTEWFSFCRRLERQGKCALAFPRGRIHFEGSGSAPYEHSVFVGMGSFTKLYRIEEVGTDFPTR